ncbi:MAG: HNH endonuclease [Gammaproteobacteria bacterium]|nr:HNH endonuclease [Gammaproteobacteria bacterium]
MDNGFDVDLGRGDWLASGSSQTSLRIWLSSPRDSLFVVAVSRADVLDSLAGRAETVVTPMPSGAAGAFRVDDIAALHQALRRAFQLSRTLPDALLNAFSNETANLPRTTEAERLVVQRIGQGIFRRGLLEFWDGRCAVTGIDVPELLRASHIKPWTDCATDSERLDVFNGLLLAPHLDAAFDAGFITVAEDGAVLISPDLPPDTHPALGLRGSIEVVGLDRTHEHYLRWHRANVFRGSSDGETL